MIKKILSICLAVALVTAPSKTAYADTGTYFGTEYSCSADEENNTLTVTIRSANTKKTRGDMVGYAYWYALLNNETISTSAAFDEENDNRQRMLWKQLQKTESFTVADPVFAESCSWKVVPVTTSKEYSFVITIVITNPSPELTGIGFKAGGLIENSHTSNVASYNKIHLETPQGGFDVCEEVAILNKGTEPVVPTGVLRLCVCVSSDEYYKDFGTPAFRFSIVNDSGHCYSAAFVFDDSSQARDGYLIQTKDIEISGNEFEVIQKNIMRYEGNTTDGRAFQLTDGDIVEIRFEEQLVKWTTLSHMTTSGEL